MARRDHGQRVGEDLSKALMRGRRDFLFAFVCGGGDPHLPSRCKARELGEFAPVGWQRRRVELDVAGDQDVWRAKRRETVAVRFAAREAYVKLLQERTDEARRPSPSAERALADPPIDHCEHRFRSLQLNDHIGPEFALRHQRGVRTPALDKPPDEHRTVERRILVQRAGRKALREHGGRGHCRRGHERGRAHARDALNERQQYAGFADTGAMQPDERARRTGEAGLAPPLAHPSRILLAAPEPHRQERPSQRSRQERGQSIAGERERSFHRDLRSAPGSVAPTMA